MKQLNEMTREELLEYIEDLKTKRAFSYEDQIKLAILDRSPFSVWASDRDYRITLWAGQCESMYGYSKEEVLGKSYIDKFVAEDERATAKRDHLCIVDDGKPYHNLARDEHIDGSHPLILTNCFRIRDPKSNEYWYAEMGLNIEFFDEELKKYNEMVMTSQRIKECRNKLDEYSDQFKEQISDRKKSFIKALVDGSKTVQASESSNYQSALQSIIRDILEIEEKIDKVATDYSTKITSCDDIDRCEKIYKAFILDCNTLETEFNLIEMKVFALLNAHNSAIAKILAEKDRLIKLIIDQGKRINEDIEKKIAKAQGERKEFEKIQGAETLEDYDNLIGKYRGTAKRLFDLEDELRKEVLAISSEEEIPALELKINQAFERFENEE